MSSQTGNTYSPNFNLSSNGSFKITLNDIKRVLLRFIKLEKEE